MKAKFLLSIGSAVLASRIARTIQGVDADTVLGRVGLARNRSHIAENLPHPGAGLMVGAGAALLLAPESGRDTRARIGRKIDELGEAAASAVESVENHISRRSSQSARGAGQRSSASLTSWVRRLPARGVRALYASRRRRIHRGSSGAAAARARIHACGRARAPRDWRLRCGAIGSARPRGALRFPPA